MIADPYAAWLDREGEFQLIITLLTSIIVDGAEGAEGTIAAIAVTILENELYPIELRDSILIL
jgi:hypothetical protein